MLNVRCIFLKSIYKSTYTLNKIRYMTSAKLLHVATSGLPSSGILMEQRIMSYTLFYVGHLENKERLHIQPAQLFNFSC